MLLLALCRPANCQIILQNYIKSRCKLVLVFPEYSGAGGASYQRKTRRSDNLTQQSSNHKRVFFLSDQWSREKLGLLKVFVLDSEFPCVVLAANILGTTAIENYLSMHLIP